MRPQILAITLVAAAIAPSAPPASAQDAELGSIKCERGPGRPDCLDRNPFYTPPLGSVRATDRDMQVLARAMQANQPRRATAGSAPARLASAAVAGAPGNGAQRCRTGTVRVVYGGYGEPACAQ
jgi:hypothetical protein